MSSVLPRSYKDFPLRRIIIEKVVDRKLGHEADVPPPGWYWDYRHLVEDKIGEYLPAPGLKDSHLLGLPRGYWQNGPVEGKLRTSLEIKDITKVFAKDKHRWAPIIHRGNFNNWRQSGYFFSDDSVVETVSWTSLDPLGHSLHILRKFTRADSPISATIFRRVEGENIPWRNYTRRQKFTGILDSSGVEGTTREGDVIYWSQVDTTRREFISYASEDLIKCLFNKHVGESITGTATPTLISDFNDYEYLGSSTGEDSQQFFSEYFPISNDSVLEIYVVDSTLGTWKENAIVDSFTAANQVKVDTDLGILTVGASSGSTPPPVPGMGIYLRYRAVPRIEYEEDGYGDTSVAIDADVNPINQSLNRGFVVLSRSELDVASITLETTKPSYGGTVTSFGPVYVGSDYAPLIATVRSSSGQPVPDAEVTFFIISTPRFGSLGSSGFSVERRTEADGKARTVYLPPVSADDLGSYVYSVGAGNTLSLGGDIQFDNPDEVYTYHVLKDDPFQGIVGADTELGEVEWSGAPPNGRRVVLYKWKASAINPVTGSLGAYAPIRPASIAGGRVLTYSDTLATPDPLPSTTNLGAYWVVSDCYLTILASAKSPRYNRRVVSNPLTLRIALPDYMKGSYIKESLDEIPFGWRLTGAGYEVASAIEGATYITINPVAGPYPVVDIIGGETVDYTGDFWPYGAYPASGVSAPFATMSFFWNIV